jgi:hypothetical protein
LRELPRVEPGGRVGAREERDAADPPLLRGEPSGRREATGEVDREVRRRACADERDAFRLPVAARGDRDEKIVSVRAKLLRLDGARQLTAGRFLETGNRRRRVVFEPGCD